MPVFKSQCKLETNFLFQLKIIQQSNSQAIPFENVTDSDVDDAAPELGLLESGGEED